ncbi:hypothetical protein [Streptomyces sp. NPDC003247]|uniref:hypothetical protein n=1 Tax=Streptomyces sp. NPDC003247 TaxID=3364677 RepID=UPI0036BC93FB
MSQQYPPQQPNQPHPQQPGWGGGPQPGFPPPPKRRGVGKILGLGCAGIIGLFVLIGVISAIAGGGSGDNESGSAEPAASAASAAEDDKPAADAESGEAAESPAKEDTAKKKVATFKVWGTAPAGALGPLDITYGSDSDSRDGTWKDGEFTATLPLDEDALYYTVTAQLQGSGDINCSVTVDGHTEKAHASGGYNICHAQANAGLLGGWD